MRNAGKTGKYESTDYLQAFGTKQDNRKNFAFRHLQGQWQHNSEGRDSKVFIYTFKENIQI